MPLRRRDNDPFRALVSLMARLRAPGGCPWDRRQTHRSIARNILEEAHEAFEAIVDGNPAHLMEELGDVLLQVLFHSQMASEKKRFTIDDVCRVIHEKLIRRHPHVFGTVKLKGATAVLKQWERIKMEERKEKGSNKGVLDGIPKSLSGLIQAYRLGEKAGRVGFDWKNDRHVWTKVEEEMKELRRELEQSGGQKRMEEELGDLLFTLIQYARHARIDPEQALLGANRKFRKRFKKLEGKAHRLGKSLNALGPSLLERWWQEVKQTSLSPSVSPSAGRQTR